MSIEYRRLSCCDKCKSTKIKEENFSEIHGYWYGCLNCGYHCWGGRLKNKIKNEKRPPCPAPRDLGIDACQMCLLAYDHLGYSEVLETHHIDDNPQNNDRLNLFVACTSCHKLIHHQRNYRYTHYMRRSVHDND
jgi:hypothetical protein